MSQMEIVITPSAVEYEQLVRDIETLRELDGARSKTAAVLAAVRRAAREYDSPPAALSQPRTNAMNPDTRR
jgi:hypothetical protein